MKFVRLLLTLVLALSLFAFIGCSDEIEEPKETSLDVPVWLQGYWSITKYNESLNQELLVHIKGEDIIFIESDYSSLSARVKEQELALSILDSNGDVFSFQLLKKVNGHKTIDEQYTFTRKNDEEIKYRKKYNISNTSVENYLHIIKYKITYNPNGGSIANCDMTRTVNRGEPYDGIFPNVSREGYILVGWSFEKDDLDSSISEEFFGSFVDFDSDKTLYAIWTNNEHTLSFDAQTEDVENPNDKTLIYDKEYGELPVLTRSEFDFQGWWTEKNGNGEKITSPSVFRGTKDVTLFAYWTPKEYTITYNGNGATSGSVPSEAIKISIEDFIVSKNIGNLKKTGYAFVGWNTQEDGNGTDYPEESLYKINEDFILYAKWIPTYEISFHAQGGDSLKPAKKTVVYGHEYGELASTNRVGHTFGGWWTQVNGKGDLITANTIVAFHSDQTLYAQWIPNEYTVSFDSQGGESVEGISVTYGYAYGLLPVLTRSEYDFQGWWTGKNGNGEEITSSSVFRGTKNVTLFAYWTPKQYTITYVGNSETSGSVPAKAIKISIEDFVVSKNTGNLKKTGYAFVGWNTQEDGNGTDYPEEGLYKINGDLILYAKWMPAFEITFNAQEGDNPKPAKKTVVYGHEYGELASTNRRGHTFGGWWAQENGEGALISANTIVALQSDQTLYAKWTPNEYTVSFDSQGGESVEGIAVTFGQKYGPLPEPNRDNNIFRGWFTEREGGGSEVRSSYTYSSPNNQILYAKWELVVFEGPAGGLVFYENLNHESDGWRYLEAAPYGWYKGDTHSYGAYYGTDDPRFQWGVYGKEIGSSAQGVEIGTGASNTDNIVGFHDSLGKNFPEIGDFYQYPKKYNHMNDGTVAAKICAEFSLERDGRIFDDWFLPSKDELDLMHKNLYKKGLGGFSESDYWSSSEINRDYAWSQLFLNGHQANGNQYNRLRNSSDMRVRPIRVY